MCDASTKEKTNGTRLRRLLLDGGSQVLRKLFDGIHSNSALPGVLKTHEADLRKKCFPNQIELFPNNGQPDSKKFDITLLTLLLSSICSLTAPPAGWRKEPSSSDQSEEANIVRIRLFRNKIQHLPGSGISDEQFEGLWNELSSLLMALGLPEYEIKKIKASPIDDSSEVQERFKTLCEHEHRIVNLEETINEHGARIREITEELQYRKKQETVKSCIPDEPSTFIAREEELKEIIDAKTIDENFIPYVLIHGMAGIGKSTLIKKASWKLVNKHKKTVYFVDLYRCKATEEEISKTINYSVYRGTKVENEPRKALNIWARNLDRNVILVLDNAEHVLNSSESRTGNDGNSESGVSCFVKILLELRKFSSLNVNYLIASREILNFDAIDVPNKDITLKPLEKNESLEFINLVLSKELSSELTNDRKQEIVKLCCNIPLVLRIVISLLDDYKPDELIKKLKSKPMEDILEPLKRAVSLSFEKLDDKLRGHLVRLTIFPGFFAVDSAMAVMGVNDKDDAVQVLKKLYAKSLLQREKRKYSLHPFIHEFVLDYSNMGANKYLLDEGKFNFLNYFQSLL